MKIMCKIPQYTHKNMKGFCHFSRKDTHCFTFSNHSLQLEKIPRTPKHVKSKEKHAFAKNIFQKTFPTILQSYKWKILSFLIRMYIFVYQYIITVFLSMIKL